MNNLYTDYANYIIESINLKKNQVVEIVTPFECESFANILLKVILPYTHDVYITITNTKREDNPHITDDFYLGLMKKEFVRITITSPFTLSRDKYYIESQTEELKEYFHNNISQRTMVSVPNLKWATMLGITQSELLEKIIEISKMENTLKYEVEKLNRLNLKYLNITTGLGTNLSLELTKDFKFNTGILKSKKNIEFKANIPSLEIFTSPYKLGVNGKLVGSKPIFIKDRVIPKFSLEFVDGKVVSQMGLDSALNLDESMNYVGEIGIANFKDSIFYSTLLDENLATHIAIGNSFKMGIKKSEQKKLNYSNYHIDLPIGTSDMKIIGVSNKGFIYELFRDGVYVYS